MKKLIIIIIFTTATSCNSPTREQIAGCVSKCRSINAKTESVYMRFDNVNYPEAICVCSRSFWIWDIEGTHIDERK